MKQNVSFTGLARRLFVLPLCLIIFCTSAYAAEVKLFSDDGTTNDAFGYSVSVSGDYAIVGAPYDDDNGSDSGSAYIFYRSGSTWTQQAKLTPDDGAESDRFGFSAALSGDYAIVGAYHDDDNGVWSGSAYIFYRSGSTWTQQAKLTADDAAENDSFGTSVSISGDYALIGVPDDDDNGNSSGSAYIFYRSGSTWTQQAKLTADDGASANLFGHSVSVSGDYALVGASQNAANGVLYSGAAYIFYRSGSTWTQQAKLTADDAASIDLFGYSVSLSDDYALIGAVFDDDNGSNSGSAYVFYRSGSTWTQQAKLIADDGSADERFGSPVSISGDYAIIGVEKDDDLGTDSGSAYIFHRSGSTWTQQTKLTASDGEASDKFGISVNISSDYALVGTLNGDGLTTGTGSVYIYDGFAAPAVSPACFVSDFGTSGGNGGIHAYNATDGFFQIAEADPAVMLGADADSDGKDEIYAGFSSGFSSYINGTWTRLTPAVAQNIIAFNGGMVIDFGTTGLWIYDGSTWTRLTTSDASVMAAVNIDGSGSDELAVLFSNGASGVYIYNGAWSRISTSAAENILEYNGQLVVDFGSSGLFLWNGSAWTQLNTGDAGLMHSGNMQGDSTPELTVHFPSGIFYYDGSAWSSAISTSAPEDMISYKGKLYADFGGSGLSEYDGTSAWTQISSSDPVCLAVADADNDSTDELAVASADGISTWNGSAWGPVMTIYVPEAMMDVTQ